MLGIILLIFIGQSFYQLAKKHDKPVWLWVIISIATYYFGGVIFGLIYGLYLAVSGNYQAIDNISSADPIILLISIGGGVIAVWGLRKILEKNWKGQAPMDNSDLIDNNFDLD